VLYYLELADTWRRERRLERKETDYSSFLYEASVEFLPDTGGLQACFQQVYVARMKMTFVHHCGPLCGIKFVKERTVVLNQLGVVLHVEGDGITDFLQY